MNTSTTNTPTMSSREIAELTGKQHFHVMRDIRAMLDSLYPKMDYPSNQSLTIEYDAHTKRVSLYHLDRDLTDCLLTGYSAKARMAVIKRWRELEGRVASVSLPDFSDPIAAAEAWIKAKKAEQLAIATKAEIGSRREATAMNTASQATKRANRLEVELDQSAQYATVKRMQMLHHGQKFKWQELKAASAEMELPPIKVFDQNYGTVNSYHRDVWLEVYALSVEGI